MKKVLILLTVLALAASPAVASNKLEAGAGKKQVQAKHHVLTQKEKKQAKKKQEKKHAKKLAKRNARKHKVAV